MPPTPRVTEPADLAARLRAAGCVFAEDEAALLLAQANTPAGLELMVARRIGGEPLEHVLGWAEFAGQRIGVRPGVFVPRRRTELLLRLAVELGEAARTRAARGTPPRLPVVLDLCCGTGALGFVLADRLGPVELYAADIEPAAVECARRNLAPIGGQVFAGDLFDPLPTQLRARVDVLAANAPYVPSEAIRLLPPEARDHEPLTALDGGGDGLDLCRRVVSAAPDWLAPGGSVLVETSEEQSSSLAAHAERAGLATRVVIEGEDATTVVVATRPDAQGGFS